MSRPYWNGLSSQIKMNIHISASITFVRRIYNQPQSSTFSSPIISNFLCSIDCDKSPTWLNQLQHSLMFLSKPSTPNSKTVSWSNPSKQIFHHISLSRSSNCFPLPLFRFPRIRSGSDPSAVARLAPSDWLTRWSKKVPRAHPQHYIKFPIPDEFFSFHIKL